MDTIQQEMICRLEQSNQEKDARLVDHDLLGEIKKDLLGSRTSPEAYQVLAHYAPRLFPGSQGALYVQNAVEHSTFERVATWGDAWPRKRFFTQDQCRALQHMKPYQADSGRCHGLVCRHVSLPEDRCSLCLPLLSEGAALGVLHLVNAEGTLTPWKRKMAEELTNYCALLLANLRLRELLSEQAVRDPLTRLFNRRHMEESLRRELAVRTHRPVGVIMVDIDHFKQFNTRFNYDGGDELLRAFGRFLQKQIRPGDIACRFGGEEFILILPGANLNVTAQRAENLREAVKQLQVTHKDQPLDRITLSVGVAIARPGMPAEFVLEIVGQAVGQAKREGRDRVVIATSCQPATCP